MSVAFSFTRVERAPSPAALDLGVDLDLDSPNPQPAIVFWPSHQPAPHRILPNVFHFFFEALLRPQNMIKRLFLPRRPRPSQRPVQAMRGRRFNTLQNLNQAIKIPVQVAKRCQQKMYMVRHNHDRMNRSLRPSIMQTMPQYNVSDHLRQRIEAAAKRDEHLPLVLLIVWQPPPILVLPLQQCLAHQNMNSK